MFSKSCEYGIRSMLFIASKSLKSQRTRLKEIAEEIKAPEAFTAKILQKLVKKDIISSVTGPKGGFYIEKEEIEKIKLIDIVLAIDGDQLVMGCGLGLPKCDARHPCPVHDRFKEVKNDLIKLLTEMNVYQMATDVECGKAFLRY